MPTHKNLNPMVREFWAASRNLAQLLPKTSLTLVNADYVPVLAKGYKVIDDLHWQVQLWITFTTMPATISPRTMS